MSDILTNKVLGMLLNELVQISLVPRFFLSIRASRILKGVFIKISSKMRPAGMSSEDEEIDEEEETYFSINKPAWRESNVGVDELKDDSEGVDEGVERIRAFHKAAEQGDLDTMKIIIQIGVNVDESDPKEWTPLMKACSRGHHEIVEFLLVNGADPNAERDLFTPLMACCICSYIQEEGRLNCLKILIQHGANVNARDKFGATPLMSACASGLYLIVQELLSVPDIDINATDKDGWNALFFAVNNNYKMIAFRLVNAGINLKTTNVKKMNAYQLASIKGFVEIMDILKPKEENVTVEKWREGEPLAEFLSQMPEEDGEGGFHSDVRGVFKGLGMEGIYEKCQINVSMPDFLLMGDDLDKLGINLGPIKWKILSQGIHRYHIYPWKKNSLHVYKQEEDFSFEDVINCLGNVTKHLAVMRSTLKYIRMRIPKRIKGNNSIDKEIITSLVNSYVEVDQIKATLMEIKKAKDKIIPVGEQEADLVQPIEEKPVSDKYMHHYFYWLLAGSAAALLYYKLR